MVAAMSLAHNMQKNVCQTEAAAAQKDEEDEDEDEEEEEEVEEEVIVMEEEVEKDECFRKGKYSINSTSAGVQGSAFEAPEKRSSSSSKCR